MKPGDLVKVRVFYPGRSVLVNAILVSPTKAIEHYDFNAHSYHTVQAAGWNVLAEFGADTENYWVMNENIVP